MKRLIIGIVVGIIVAVGITLWLVPWLNNGGWPSSGRVGDLLPPNVVHVSPGDGAVVADTGEYCVHFNYEVGNGMDEGSQETARYFLDGWDVTQQVYDIISLEYPTQIGEPCYRSVENIKPGWHTAKVSYEDNDGDRYEYKWRFQVVSEE